MVVISVLVCLYILKTWVFCILYFLYFKDVDDRVRVERSKATRSERARRKTFFPDSDEEEDSGGRGKRKKRKAPSKRSPPRSPKEKSKRVETRKKPQKKVKQEVKVLSIKLLL